MKSFKNIYILSIALVASITSMYSAALHNELTPQNFPVVLIDNSMNFPDMYPDLDFGFNALHKNFQEFVLKKWAGKNMQEYVVDKKGETINIATQIIEQSQNEIVKGFIKNEALREQFITLCAYNFYKQYLDLEPIDNSLLIYIESIDYMKPVLKYYIDSLQLDADNSSMNDVIKNKESRVFEPIIKNQVNHPLKKKILNYIN